MVAGGWPGTEELAKTADWPGAETLAVLHSAGFEHITVRESPPN
jgi:hypothetical protein